MNKNLKLFFTIIVTIILTSVAVDATDTFSGKGGTMLANIFDSKASTCPADMIHVTSALTFSCVDRFEASPASSCTHKNVSSQIDTEINLSRQDCRVEGNGEGQPWTFVNREQAQIFCARSGKRLPSASEWYQFALGTDVEKCNIQNDDLSTNYSDCVSAVGVNNTVGNVWEWVNDDVINGKYDGRNLPETGYVVLVDNDGVATETQEARTKELSGEYFWMNATGTFGMLRGGFYGSKDDAGVFTLHAHTLPTYVSAGIGFRCIK